LNFSLTEGRRLALIRPAGAKRYKDPRFAYFSGL